MCGFLISLSSVFSLECNIKYCRNNECPRDETRPCGAGLQCRTLTFNFERSGTLMLQNECSSNCDEEEYCSSLTEICSKYNTITNCALRCCNTDLCNAPGTYEVLQITESSYATIASFLLNRLHWDNLSTRRKKLKAMLMLKTIRGLSPAYLPAKLI